jgi:hypothetical protein
MAKEEQHCMQSSNENRPFEQIGKPQWDPSGVFRISYGSGLDDPMPFASVVTQLLKRHCDRRNAQFAFELIKETPVCAIRDNFVGAGRRCSG